MNKKKKKAIIIIVLIVVSVISIFFIRKVNEKRRIDESHARYLEKRILVELGYYSLREYYTQAIFPEEREAYYNEMLKDPNFPSKLELAFELLNDDCADFGDNKKFEPITVDRIRNNPQEVHDELDGIKDYLNELYDQGTISDYDSKYMTYYMKTAEDKLKESGKYIEWDEWYSGNLAFLDFWTQKISEIESNKIKKTFQQKKLEMYKKKVIYWLVCDGPIFYDQYESVCVQYEEEATTDRTEKGLKEFEKIMQEENPELGYGTDYELITTDRLLNDYDSVYDELTGEMSDKLDEKYGTKHYISTIFYHTVLE